MPQYPYDYSPYATPPFVSPNAPDDQDYTPDYGNASTASSSDTLPMPARDKLLSLLSRRQQQVEQHPTPLWRRVLGGLTQGFSPALANAIGNPGGNQFNQEYGLANLQSQAELAGLKEQESASNIQSNIEYRKMLAQSRQQTADERAQANENAMHRGELTIPSEEPVDVNLGGLPSLEQPQSNIAEPAPSANPPAVPASLLPLMTKPRPALQGTVNAQLPVPQGYLPAAPYKNQPPGTMQVRITPEEAAREKKLGEQADWQPLGDEITSALKLPQGTRVPPASMPHYADAYLKTQQTKQPTEVGLALQAAGGDPVKALQLYAQTKQNSTRISVNSATADKQAITEAVRKAYQDAGGDWSKVLDNAQKLQYGDLSSDIAAKAASMVPKIPATEQRRVSSAQSTVDTVQQAINAIQQFASNHPDLVGSGYTHPGSGIKRWWETKTGTEPADIGGVDSLLASVAALQPGQHGFRSREAMDEFKQALGIDLRTHTYDPNRAWLINPAKAIDALRQVANFNATLKGNIAGAAGQTNPNATKGKPDPLGIR